MGMRYVWDKYTVIDEYEYTEESGNELHLFRYNNNFELEIVNVTTLYSNDYTTENVVLSAGDYTFIARHYNDVDTVYIHLYNSSTLIRYVSNSASDKRIVVYGPCRVGRYIGEGKGDFIERISAASMIYDSDYNYNGYWYVYQGSDNIDPNAISYPSSIRGGDTITLTTTKSSSNTYGGTITYIYEVQLSGSSWTSIGNSTSLTKSYTVPAGTTTFRARVKAKDNMGFASTTYTTGNQVTVINNAAPTISGSNSNLGSFAYLPPYIEYVINDVDGNTVSVSIQLDSQSIYSGTAVLDKTEFIVFSDWDSLSNGSHTITITANDGQGGMTSRTYTFSKSVNANLISRERWRRLNEGNVYDVIYFETAADVVTTNNGKYLRDRINAILSRIAALKGTSVAALAAMDSSIVTERLHMKTDSGYNVKYLDTKSQYVKIGSQTVEEVLTQIESDIAAMKG